ncbi:MAG: hypothetical protein K2P78_04750, partial [Gemmataceae bacterium]|nr:hypothetical protein [Gemmataceae bacterium]
MSTTPPTTSRTLGQQWSDFWFAPRNPTTLGFIRVMTGLLVLYAYLAYSLDLQAFFGKYGWWGAQYIERERKEYPWQQSSFWDWNEDTAQAALPEYPHRHAAVVEFIRTVGDLPPAERERALRFVNRLAKRHDVHSAIAVDYLLSLGTVDKVWDTSLYYLVEDRWPDDNRDLRRFPPKEWMTTDLHGNREFPKDGPEGRATVADEIKSFRDVLPRDPDKRLYVLSHLKDLDQAHRRAFASFLNTLPDNKAERDKLIDFLDYWNLDPKKTTRRGHAIFSVWFHVTDPTQMAAVHAVVLVIIFLFTVGFCTRVTSVLTWLATVGYIHRSQQVLFGQDTMSNILLIYLMIGNSGAALSVDRVIARYRAVRASLRRSGTIDPATRAFLATPPASAGAGLGVRLIQIHFCFIYMAAGLSKLKGTAWWNGQAFWDVMVNPEFTLLRYHWFEAMVRGLSEIKPVYYAMTALGVWFTWGLEISFGFLVWTRARPVMIWFAVILHALIAFLMGLYIFELLMMVMLLAFIPAG